MTDFDAIWSRYVSCEAAIFRARAELLESVPDLDVVVARALDRPNERGAALRLLLSLELPDRITHFEHLVLLASVGQSDIHLVRQVLETLPAKWLHGRLWTVMEGVLEESGDEEYRRFAELLEHIGFKGDLAKLVDMAARSDDPHVLEVARDFERVV